MFEIRYVPRETLAELFDSVSIQRALDYSDEEDIGDMYKALADSRRMLLLIYDDNQKVADVTIQKIEYPQITALRVCTISGSRYEEWKADLDSFLIMWAKEEHIDRIEFMGRKGHQRVLKDMGYQPRYVFMTKDIHYE